MKKLLRFLRKYRSLIQTGSLVVLSVAVIGLSLVYMLADILIPGSVFFLAALLMLPLALNYSKQRKKSKGVFIFYAVTAAVCIIAGLVQIFVPAT